MDGVIVDFMKGAHEYHGLEYPNDNYTDGVGNFTDKLPMSSREFWSPLDGEFWAGLDWTPDGKEIINIVLEYHLVNDVSLLTTPTLHIECASGKMQWIKNNLLRMYRRTIITPAKEMCAHPDALLIDDADHNVNKWRDNGGVAILVPRIWNSRHAEANDTVEILRKEIRDAGIGSVPRR